jgi:hypothetical protein
MPNTKAGPNVVRFRQVLLYREEVVGGDGNSQKYSKPMTFLLVTTY